MDKLDRYILVLLNRFELARKRTFLFQIMSGKRTGQAIQEAHLYQVDHLFGLTPFLSEALLCKRLESLLRIGYIEETKKGIRALVEAKEPLFKEPFWAGFLIGRRAETFFRRLELIVQVLSNRKHKKNQYLPIIRDEKIQQFTKKWLKENLCSSQEIKEELFVWLSNKHILYPQIYSDRFSGGRYTGKTAEQIYNQLNLPFWDGYFYFLEGLHFLFAEQKNYPWLNSIMPPHLSILTLSSYRSYELYNKGLQMEEIAKIRQLKLSTIEDHFVEIKASFPYVKVPGIPSFSVIQQIKSRKWQSLKEVKESFPYLTYFQIRLAIVSKKENSDA